MTLIRDVDERDLPAITAIYNHYIVNTTVSFEEEVVGADVMRERVEKVAGAGLPWLVIEENDVLGYAYASHWSPRPAYRHTVEVTVYLDPAATGRGLGTRIYQALFERLRGLGVRIVVAGITLPNPASVTLHEKLGMQPAGRFNEVGFKFDRWLDVGYWHGKLYD